MGGVAFGLAIGAAGVLLAIAALTPEKLATFSTTTKLFS
jgi:hypothetical protein